MTPHTETGAPTSIDLGAAHMITIAEGACDG